MMTDPLTRAEVKQMAKDIVLHAGDIRKHATDWRFVAIHARAVTVLSNRLRFRAEQMAREETEE